MSSISDYCGFSDLECCSCFKKVFPKQQIQSFFTLSILRKARLGNFGKMAKPKVAFGCAGGCGCSSEDKPTNTVQEIKPIKWQ